ncbi:hypothetical protein CgunFtcFv8_022062 [Champsocephalus gunnari]|uniref:Uncharacterized protein n=1 Tax=Champsocephalus gunnari TaxID=52237 RepID=A0AAN8DQK6_CHAGU|nr:hypothetical protein CgunFtcFv8_022062 [Champsocephalus gunnari]
MSPSRGSSCPYLQESSSSGVNHRRSRTVCTIATIIFILLIVPRVRRWVCSRRRARRVERVPNNEYVYEVMTARGLRPALEQSSSSTYTVQE